MEPKCLAFNSYIFFKLELLLGISAVAATEAGTDPEHLMGGTMV
jgi:hypothetical protein